jgi:hypothetical protein
MKKPHLRAIDEELAAIRKLAAELQRLESETKEPHRPDDGLPDIGEMVRLPNSQSEAQRLRTELSRRPAWHRIPGTHFVHRPPEAHRKAQVASAAL